MLHRDSSGEWVVEPGSGGLVEALTPILRERDGVWIGWTGIASGEGDDAALPSGTIARAREAAGVELLPVALGADEIAGYYGGLSNSALWPLFHGLTERCVFEPTHWPTYLAVNDKFAETACSVRDASAAWIHDYHLIPMAERMRQRGFDRPLGFFLHTPFPPLQLFVQLPWRGELLRALLAYDLLGFQTERDRRNFLDCVDRLMHDADVSSEDGVIATPAGVTRAAAFPIGIAARQWRHRASSRTVDRLAAELRADLRGMKLILGVDRLDYSKGVLQRLDAFERALDESPELREKVVLVQVQVPSREGVEEYQALKDEIERSIGRITGRFATARWTPIRYMYRTVDRDALAAMYRVADMLLVTSLCDGMNLVSKEFCACQVDDPGVLVLSEQAGAAAQLADGALLVNPRDVEGTSAALRQGLAMPRRERAARMARLWRSVADADVFRWADEYLDALLRAERRPGRARHTEEYLPVLDAPGHSP